ncbi:proprotein convertase P-domain-containing protein [Echinicola sp. 20G]|uniref:proprotein convertase P-domain-containing protein n=1 Tax=Echinicola sp. 20G TaxID=2781961 RepID=UPI0019101ED0|nr:proprotein convertase P-domain-containing protein [Echinicola sp. 20G]
MAKSNKLYTYRNGKKQFLHKKDDQYIVRATPKQLSRMGLNKHLEQVSSASTKVEVDPEILENEMQIVRKNAVAHHAYTREEDDSSFLITDRIIVTFKAPITHDQLSEFMAKYALLLKRKYSDLEYLFQLTDETGMNPIKLVVTITEKEKDLVELCEHDLNHTISKSNIAIPIDPNYISQWHLHKRLTDQEFDIRSSANCENAWKALEHFGDNNVVIGVTDDGCKLNHPDFDSTGKFASWGYMQGLNLIDRDAVSANPNNMYETGADHGTNCCGVVAAEVDANLTVGAAPGCKLLPIKWESSGSSLYISDDKIFTVLEYVKDKVDVLSNSWGSSPHGNYASFVVNKIKSLAQNGGRRGKGIVFLWAAGNENCPINFSGNQNIPYTSGYGYGPTGSVQWVGVQTSKNFSHNLGGIPGVMFVAALASNAQRSHYSNYGPDISVTAPSSNIHKYYRMSVPGLGITTTSGDSSLIDNEFGGTSSATPLVAGIAGLVISANPNLSAYEVISILQRTASKDLNMSAYSRTPPASYDPDTSWDISPVSPFHQGDFTDQGYADGTWSPWFGFGKVDAEAAVVAALGILPPTPSPQEEEVNVSSSPNLAIPDRDEAGVFDEITINEAGTVGSLSVEIDISHTYIGDLKIALSSPDGTTILLHNRNGGGSNDLEVAYDEQSLPALLAFKGKEIKGKWKLQVTDHALQDIGTVNSWQLRIQKSTSQQNIEVSESPGIKIPDSDPIGISRELNIDETGLIQEIEVKLDITHTYIGDLLVTLISPSSTKIILHNKTGGSSNNLIKNFSMTNTPILQSLSNENAKGKWKLHVADTFSKDIGKLNSWALSMSLK